MTVDLSTGYLGLKLKNPLVIAACPLTQSLDSLRRLEDAGAAAVVLPSLFEEQIEHEETELSRVHEIAMADGMIPLRQVGIRKMLEGVTTYEEIISVT